MESSICGYAGSSCPDSACSSPLKPAGHCCWNFCGAILHISSPASLSVRISTLQAIASDHAGQHTLHYVRKVGDLHHQILLVPSKQGNLTATAKSATSLSNYLMMELKSSKIYVEYSGTSPPPSALAQAGTALGWIILIALLVVAGLYVHTKYTGRPITMPSFRSASAYLPSPIWRQEDLSDLRRRAEAPFHGFAHFKNLGEGDGVVQIEGLDKENITVGSDVMILKPEDLKTDVDDLARSRSFSNPMFNVEPPSNIYSKEPTDDITFGVDNPTYVALSEIKADDKDEKDSHYEVIGNIEDVGICIPKILIEKDTRDTEAELLCNTTHEEVQEIEVSNDHVDTAETKVPEEELLSIDTN